MAMMLDAIATAGLAFSGAGISLVAGVAPMPSLGAVPMGGLLVVGGLAMIALSTDPDDEGWHPIA